MAQQKDDDTRDGLITLAQHGKITPEEAEAKALANGWPPFAARPAMPAFDPMQQSRWPLVMALAWIAWRDLDLTRGQCPEFRAECYHWIFREWGEPVKNGTAFEPRKGWFLEQLSAPTGARLGISDTYKLKEGTPPSRQMSVRDAEKALWQSLENGHLVAEALNSSGSPVDIPQREWSYLKLFEEWDRDTLKFDALGNPETYSHVKLKRDDLLRVWPRVANYSEADERTLWPIEPYMLKPISAVGNAGFVPLCATLQWIMSGSGRRETTMDDPAWYEAVEQLWPLVCSGEMELVGLEAGHSKTARLPGHALTLVKVLPPLHNSIGDILLNAQSHVACTPFVDQKHWEEDFNDKLYERGRGTPTWSHLQLRKDQVLKKWPREASKISAEQACYRWLLAQMQDSPETRPKSKGAFATEAKKSFPGLAARQFTRAWSRAISDSSANWDRPGRPKKSNQNGK